DADPLKIGEAHGAMLAPEAPQGIRRVKHRRERRGTEGAKRQARFRHTRAGNVAKPEPVRRGRLGACLLTLYDERHKAPRRLVERAAQIMMRLEYLPSGTMHAGNLENDGGTQREAFPTAAASGRA